MPEGCSKTCGLGADHTHSLMARGWHANERGARRRAGRRPPRTTRSPAPVRHSAGTTCSAGTTFRAPCTTQLAPLEPVHGACACARARRRYGCEYWVVSPGWGVTVQLLSRYPQWDAPHQRPPTPLTPHYRTAWAAVGVPTIAPEAKVPRGATPRDAHIPVRSVRSAQCITQAAAHRVCCRSRRTAAPCAASARGRSVAPRAHVHGVHGVHGAWCMRVCLCTCTCLRRIPRAALLMRAAGVAQPQHDQGPLPVPQRRVDALPRARRHLPVLHRAPRRGHGLL